MELDNVQSNYKTSYQPSNDVQTQTATPVTQAPVQETTRSDDKQGGTQSSAQSQQSAILELSADGAMGNVIDDKNLDKNKDSDKGSKHDKNIKDAVSEINKKIKSSHQELQMSQHAVTKAIMVKLVNSDTKEVVREFPPEKVQDMIAKMWEIAGIIVDEKR